MVFSYTPTVALDLLLQHKGVGGLILLLLFIAHCWRMIDPPHLQTAETAPCTLLPPSAVYPKGSPHTHPGVEGARQGHWAFPYCHSYYFFLLSLHLVCVCVCVFSSRQMSYFPSQEISYSVIKYILSFTRLLYL